GPLLDEVLAGAGPSLQARVGAFRTRHRLPGVAAGLATAEGLRWWHGSGFADMSTGRRPDSRTLFRIASISKTVTATAVMQLRDDGRLRLDDPAVRYLPELARVADPHGPIEDVTIRRLLMHTSGLQGDAPWQDLEHVWMYRPAELLALLDRVRVATPPDADTKYSNLAFELLGVIAERVAERPFTEHVRDTVLDPLAMHDSVWEPDPEQLPRCAVGYDARAHDDRPSEARGFDSLTARADGGLWSTLEDLGRWIGQQLRADPDLDRGPGQVLAGRTLAEMHRPTFVGDAAWTEAQGLCWYGTRTGETILVGHSGGIWGFITNVSFAPAGGVGAIVLLNGIGPAPALSRELVEAVLPALREAADRVEPTAPPPIVPEAWGELLGVYRDAALEGDLVVEWRGGKLVLRVGSDAEATEHELVPTADPLVFTMRGGRPAGEPLAFVRGASGRIESCNAAGYPAARLDLVRVVGKMAGADHDAIREAPSPER
ncbi:MAG TPA: serine hydrolase domain-containing protein, partial [Candidatus Limnocylindrales bacterium]|nr:serine hydrolase domain-containing protein [Candidatus Limnocylindrales bacterium]